MNDKTTHDPTTETIARTIRAQYQSQLQAALGHYAAIERQMTRAAHEVKRIEHHLAKIDAFCTENNIAVTAQKGAL